MPIIDRATERRIVEEGRKQGKSDAFIKAAVLRFREQKQAEMQSAEQPTAPKKGFLRNVAEGIAKPFAQVGVAATNFGESIGDLARGDVRGANEALSKERNVPLLGKTKPFATGKETAGGAAKAALGTGLEIASTIVGGGGVGTVGKSAVKGLGKQALKQGAKIGAVTGNMSGLGQELQVENSTARSALKAGLGGALTGAVVGGALGGVGGAIGSKVKNTLNRAKNKVSREAFEVIQPELNKFEKISALEQGRGVKGKNGIIEILPSSRDLQVAKAVEGVVSKKKDFLENIVSVRGEIKREAEMVRAGLQKSKMPFKELELAEKLSAIEKPPLVASDTTLNNAYDIAQNKFFEFVSKEKRDLEGLLNARQKFDSWIEQSFPRIFDNENWRPLHTALRDMRTTANEFIAEKLPAGNMFKSSLKRQSLMYEAIENLAGKSYKEVGTNAPQRFGKKHPILKKAAIYGGSAAATGLGVKGLIQ